jgi:hypothetical protein
LFQYEKQQTARLKKKWMYSNGIQLSIRLHDRDEAWDTNPLPEWSIVE